MTKEPVMESVEIAENLVSQHLNRPPCFSECIQKAMESYANAKVKEEREKLNRVFDFCKGAISDAIYDEDGLDGATGQTVIKMIEDAQKGLAEGCQHCSFQRNAALDEAAQMAGDFSEGHCCEDCPCSHWREDVSAKILSLKSKEPS